MRNAHRMESLDAHWENRVASFIGDEIARPLRVARACRLPVVRTALFLSALGLSCTVIILLLPIVALLMAAAVARAVFRW